MLLPGRSIETEALVVQRTPYADADWIITLFTFRRGKVSAIASRARVSKRRYSGGLEAFHNLTVRLRAAQHGEMLQLTEASISQARYGLVSELEAMQTAGRAISWLRRAFPPRIVEPLAWKLTQNCLNGLDNNPPKDAPNANARLAEYGLQLLDILGWSLELERCVRCNKPCPATASAYLSPSLGGIVCRACGGTGLVLSANYRANLQRVAHLGVEVLSAEEGTATLRVVERTLELHAGIE